MTSKIEELLSHMNPKINPKDIDPDDIDIDKSVKEKNRDKEPKHKEDKEEKHKSTIKEVSFDYYKIIGVEPTATQIEIKRAYHDKLKKLHPDRVQQTKENIAKYKLLREAGDLLMNPAERKAYDMERKMEHKTKNFDEAKDAFKQFIKLQEQSATEEDKAIAKLNFEQGLANMDRKHGFNRKDLDHIPSKEETDRLAKDLVLQREQEDIDIETQQEDVFAGRSFNQSEFNKMFLKKQKRDEKRKKQSGALTKVSDGISAFNDFADESGGVGIDNMGDVYADDKFTDYNANYAGLDAGMVGSGDGASDDISIDSPDEDEFDADVHKKNVASKDDFEAAMRKMQSEREEHDRIFESFQEKNEYGSAIDDKYGISNQFGFMVGTDKWGNQKNNKKRTVEKEEMKAYKKLTQK